MLTLSVASAPPSEALRCAVSFWANATGTGSSCAAAQADCYNNAWSEAEYACNSEYKPLCATGEFEITQACTVCDGVWTVSCRIEGACMPGPDVEH